MRFRLLIFAFFTSIALIALIGIYALNTTRQIIHSFEDSEKHFRAIATAATEVSSYVKRAEGHLMLYLVLHRKVDKEKFPRRVESLKKQISILDQKIGVPQARAILDKIKSNTRDILSVGNALIMSHDKALEDSGRFNLEAHREIVFGLHEKISAIRSFGVELATLEIELESKLRTEVMGSAKRILLYTQSWLILVAAFTVFLGYGLTRMVRTLKREMANRVRSEEAIQLETKKLQEALSEVKKLSGMLPICASCKKIKDDKGYWTQIEKYIRDHSEAVFSHGFCPECSKKLYPEFFEKKE